MDAGAGQDNRPPIYQTDDGLVIRASSFGKLCPRDAYFHLYGDQPPNEAPDAVKAAWAAGHEWEPKVLARLADLGWELEGCGQREVDWRPLPGIIVRSHCDEIGVPATTQDRRIVEVKSLSPTNFEQAQRKGAGSLPYGYDWQLSLMMVARSLPAVWVAINKETEELHIEFADELPVSKVELLKRAKMFKGLIGAADAPDCDDPTRYPCPFFHLRPEREDETVPVEGVELDQIDRWARIYDEQRAIEAAAADTKKQAREKLVEILAGRGGVRGSRFRVTRSVQIRNNFDQKKARADGVDIDAYMVPTESVRINVEEIG